MKYEFPQESHRLHIENVKNNSTSPLIGKFLMIAFKPRNDAFSINFNLLFKNVFFFLKFDFSMKLSNSFKV